ncbi:MAG: 1-deoxy-D-xylulose-5-phosphate reductoisomerase [Candidatus Didemnitutus sp.]|nr:1-deoxy-D-xylulose-5-phosphate reductoisomerase [Candidatus Didemnitutus sp.]
MADSLPRRRVVLLGATGSIGDSTLRVLRAHRDRLELVGIAAHGRHAELAAIAREFSVKHVALFDEAALAAARVSGDFASDTIYYGGASGLSELAVLPDADVVLVAVVGTAGLQPALAAIRARKTLALASKELLVMAGKFVMAEARASGSQLLPVDSEHNAVFQCLQGHRAEDVRRIVLTASGGALRDWPLERLAQATRADALRHPNWAMGPKITVDSATLANKGLELIEAQWLFGLRAEQCQAVLHAQSIVHCLVEFCDGSLLTQLCPPSMTFPLQHALLFPDRAPQPSEAALDLTRRFAFDFQPVDAARYPLLGLAQAAMAAGGVAPAVFNAANEVAVAAFLAEQVPFLAISRVVEQTLAEMNNFEPATLNDVLQADATARRLAQALLPSAS